jgi:hypothetical protein
MRGLRLSLSLTGAASGLPASLTFTSKNGMSVTPQANGSALLQKTSADAWDGAAYTATSLTGDFDIWINTLANDKNAIVGVSNSPSGTSDNSDFDVSLVFNGSGRVDSATPSGTTGQFDSYSANEFWLLRRRSGLYTVKYNTIESEVGATSLSDFGFGSTPDNTAYGAKVSLFYNTSHIQVRVISL